MTSEEKNIDIINHQKKKKKIPLSLWGLTLQLHIDHNQNQHLKSMYCFNWINKEVGCFILLLYAINS